MRSGHGYVITSHTFCWLEYDNICLQTNVIEVRACVNNDIPYVDTINYPWPTFSAGAADFFFLKKANCVMQVANMMSANIRMRFG